MTHGYKASGLVVLLMTDPKMDLLNAFRNLLEKCPFGVSRSIFVYEEFPKEAMKKYNAADNNRNVRNPAALLKRAMNESWPKNQLEFVALLSEMDMSGNFKFTFDNDDLKVCIYAGEKVEKHYNCDFPVEIKFESHSSCICC